MQAAAARRQRCNHTGLNTACHRESSHDFPLFSGHRANKLAMRELAARSVAAKSAVAVAAKVKNYFSDEVIDPHVEFATNAAAQCGRFLCGAS